MKLVLSYDEVLEIYPNDTWQNIATRDAIQHVSGESGAGFPCVFAIQAAVKGGFRFCFAEDSDSSNAAAGLRQFLRTARSIGPYATLSYIFPPETPQSLETYNARFWALLKRLHAADEVPWPQDIPYAMQDPNWSFCFDGEAIFPLCLTPAHKKKRTRYALNFSVSFQPRWTFKHHLANSQIMDKYSSLIRKRMQAFDRSAISPYLGLYGKGFLDAEKYFFHEDNLPMEFPDEL
jgi:FPC/CPF motif-containing protein YcgG